MLLTNKNRVEMAKLAPAERVKDFSEVELGYSEAEARNEANRCLSCNVGICIGCKICSEVCPNSVITVNAGFDQKENRVVNGYSIDLAKCLYCGFCAEACPTKCLHMSKIYELARLNRDEFVYDMEQLRIHKPKPGGESR
jgi:formate hydrogenlyase subunit 6/NADH:ubiquinone oxidoreductase subunit I